MIRVYETKVRNRQWACAEAYPWFSQELLTKIHQGEHAHASLYYAGNYLKYIFNVLLVVQLVLSVPLFLMIGGNRETIGCFEGVAVAAPLPLLCKDRQAGYRYQVSILQAEFSLTFVDLYTKPVRDLLDMRVHLAPARLGHGTHRSLDRTNHWFQR